MADGAQQNVKQESDKRTIKVELRKNDMEAYVNLPVPSEEKPYQPEEILGSLKERGVVFGIDEAKIEEIISEDMYNVSVLVAKGQEKKDGKDGRYEFLFDKNIDNKPKVLVDGSVDYRVLQKVQQVKKGEELIRYFPAIEGEKGYDVRGKVQIPYRGKDQKAIKGKGFIVSDDRKSYTAALDGKVEYKDDRLLVTDVFEIKEDVDYLTGDISFEGDILIHGNVTVGMTVKSTGNVTVEGHMEGATIIAGKDVVLQNGAQGAGRGKIEAKGNVSGKFFEQMEIKAGGNVNANSIMNCEIKCDGEIVVSGKLGILVGGSSVALKQVVATIIGNMSETRTEIEVGIPDAMFNMVSVFEREIEQNNQSIIKIERALEALTKAPSSALTPEVQQKKLEVMREKIRLNKEISETTQKRTELIQRLESSSEARIIALKRIYPGSKVTVNGVNTIIKDALENITIKRRGADVCLFAND